MGACCTRPNSLEDVLHQHFKNLKLRSMDYSTFSNIINSKFATLELSDSFKEKLKGKSLNAFEGSLNKISKENFIKHAETYFIDPKDNPIHIKTQKMFFELICEYSNNNKFSIMFHLLSLLDNDEEKYEKFFEIITTLENGKPIDYPKFKNLVKIFIKHTLILPNKALKESLAKVGDEKINSQNKQPESGTTSGTNISAEINEQLKSAFSDKNIDSFVNSIFEEFERLKFINFDEAFMERYNVAPEDTLEIFKKFEGNGNLFNFNGLRSFYLSQYN